MAFAPSFYEFNSLPTKEQKVVDFTKVKDILVFLKDNEKNVNHLTYLNHNESVKINNVSEIELNNIINYANQKL